MGRRYFPASPDERVTSVLGEWRFRRLTLKIDSRREPTHIDSFSSDMTDATQAAWHSGVEIGKLSTVSLFRRPGVANQLICNRLS